MKITPQDRKRIEQRKSQQASPRGRKRVKIQPHSIKYVGIVWYGGKCYLTEQTKYLQNVSRKRESLLKQLEQQHSEDTIMSFGGGDNGAAEAARAAAQAAQEQARAAEAAARDAAERAAESEMKALEKQKELDDIAARDKAEREKEQQALLEQEQLNAQKRMTQNAALGTEDDEDQLTTPTLLGATTP